MYRPAWRMNHTGVASTGSRRQALMNRVAAAVSVHLEERTRKAHEVLEPHRLEAQFGAQLAELVRHRVVEKIVAGDDGDRGVALLVMGAETPEKSQAVDEGHAQVEDDGVRMVRLRLFQPGFGVQRGV